MNEGEWVGCLVSSFLNRNRIENGGNDKEWRQSFKILNQI